MRATDKGARKREVGCLDLSPDLLGAGSVGHALLVRDMGHEPTNREGFGRITPQGGPQADGEATLAMEVRCVDIPSGGGCDGIGGPSGGGYLLLPPPENSDTVYCDQAYYGPVSGGRSENGATDPQAVVGARRVGYGGDANSGSGGGTDG